MRALVIAFSNFPLCFGDVASESSTSGRRSRSAQVALTVAGVFPICSNYAVRTRGDLLSFAIAFALRGARKLVRGLREELTEEERYRVADDVVHQLTRGDPWRLSEEIPPRKGHST